MGRRRIRKPAERGKRVRKEWKQNGWKKYFSDNSKLFHSDFCSLNFLSESFFELTTYRLINCLTFFFHFLFQFHLNKWQLSAVKATKLYKTFARLSEEDILRFFMSIIFCAWLKCLTEVTVEVESSNVVETPFEPCESTTEDFGHEVPKDIFFTESRQCLLQYFLPHRISV